MTGRLFVLVGCLGLVGCVGLAGCAAAPEPKACPAAYALIIDPATATADHGAAAPGNQQKFTAAWPNTYVSPGGGCISSALVRLVPATWTNSDPLDVSVSSANDDTNGVATCTGMSLGPVTLTATYTQDGITKTGTAQLTCH